MKSVATDERDLGAELQEAQRQLAAAQAAAEGIAGEEDEALDAGDEAFARLNGEGSWPLATLID